LSYEDVGLTREGDFQSIDIAAAVGGVFTRQSARRAIKGGSLSSGRQACPDYGFSHQQDQLKSSIYLIFA
jgi:hypothetical protein